MKQRYQATPSYLANLPPGASCQAPGTSRTDHAEGGRSALPIAKDRTIKRDACIREGSCLAAGLGPARTRCPSTSALARGERLNNHRNNSPVLQWPTRTEISWPDSLAFPRVGDTI